MGATALRAELEMLASSSKAELDDSWSDPSHRVDGLGRVVSGIVLRM